jgi:hypothetical protein
MNATPQITALSATTMTGAIIADPTTPQVVLFARDSPVQSVSYTTSYTGTAKHILTGMVQNKGFDVYMNSQKIATLSSSPQGVLTFAASQGNFNIVQAGTSTTSADVNGDSRVDVLDILVVVNDFGKTSGFNQRADLAAPLGAIDIFDVMYVVRNIGK